MFSFSLFKKASAILGMPNTPRGKRVLNLPLDTALLLDIHAKGFEIILTESSAEKNRARMVITAPHNADIVPREADDNKTFTVSIRERAAKEGIRDLQTVLIEVPQGTAGHFSLGGKASLDSSVVLNEARVDLGDNARVQNIQARNMTIIGNQNAQVGAAQILTGELDVHLFNNSSAKVDGLASSVYVETSDLSHFQGKISAPIKKVLYIESPTSKIELSEPTPNDPSQTSAKTSRKYIIG